jgi:MOSC domain-containing protein YiiM
MKLDSVNLNVSASYRHGETNLHSGIDKLPQAGPVHIAELGLAGDQIVSTKHHGGPDQAVYVYGGADYAWWGVQLGEVLRPGTFGDNLTISELETSPLCIGDRLQIGAVVLQVTAPRIPCNHLAQRMGDKVFVPKFIAAERPGAYCRVLQSGAVEAGQTVTLIHDPQHTVTLLEMFRAWYDKHLSADTVQRLLAAPLASRARQRYETLG